MLHAFVSSSDSFIDNNIINDIIRGKWLNNGILGWNILIEGRKNGEIGENIL